MTRDGLVEVNETEQTAERVSRREREADFSKPKEQPASDMPQKKRQGLKPAAQEQPEQQAPQEETQRSFRWWLAAIPLAAALLALVLCQLWRRRRLHRRIAAMAADEPREAVTQLYGYAVFLLARTGAAPPAGLEQARQDNAEAMFSGHAIPAEKATAMQRFVQEVLQACRKKRNPLQRFADRWFHIWY